MSESKYGEEKLQEMSIFRRQIIDVIKKSESFKKAPIYNLEEKGFTIAIDSRWGTGKTTFLKRLEEDLCSDSSFYAIYYNAWECDDFNNAIIPIIYKFHELLEAELDIINKEIEDPRLTEFKKVSNRLIYQIKKIALSSNISLPLGGKAQTRDGIDLFKNITNDEPLWKEKDIFHEFKEYMKTKNEFLAVLKTLVPPGYKKVIIIDELDRCRPIYAIETLEAVKHFFDIENMIFVFAIDIEQLSHSISTMYGQNMDSSGYLRRFFDLQVSFPIIKKYSFIDLQIEEKNYNCDQFICGVDKISTAFNLSLREIEKFLSYLDLLSSRILRTNYTNSLLIYYFLIVLVLKHEDFWNKLCNRSFTLGDIDLFKRDLAPSDFIPAKYFIEKLEPDCIKQFCMKILFDNTSNLTSVSDFCYKHTDYSNELLSLMQALKIPNVNHLTVIEAIKNNLSIIPQFK